MKFVPSWIKLKAISDVVAKSSFAAVLMIYGTYYIKIGGFDVSDLQITLLGMLFLILVCSVIKIYVPDEISSCGCMSDYEEKIFGKLKNGMISAVLYDYELRDNPIKHAEAHEVGYKFDAVVDIGAENLRTILSDEGYVFFYSKIKFNRINYGDRILRTILSICFVVGVLVSYWKPISMVFFIYSE